jgi:iron complex outermembrane receptor protein
MFGKQHPISTSAPSSAHYGRFARAVSCFYEDTLLKSETAYGLCLSLTDRARQGVYCIGLASVAFLVVPQVTAQESRRVLEETIVTATKRQESLRDVSLSVAVLTGEKMAEAGVENADDIGRYIPNTLISSNGRSSSVVIRGLGSGNNRGFESSVGLFIDGVYYGRDTYLQSAYFDLERVEVVRGPQGTLFGKNTIAGAINITTANPDDELGGYVKGTFGDYNKRQFEGAVSLPLSDTLGLRLSAQDSERDGYADNSGGGPDGSARDTSLARAKLNFAPNDRLWNGRRLSSRRIMENCTAITRHCPHRQLTSEAP